MCCGSEGRCVMMSVAGVEHLHPEGSGEPLRALGRGGTRLIWAAEKSLVEGFAARRRKGLKWEACGEDMTFR